MALLPNAGPPLPATHALVPGETMARLVRALRARLGANAATLELVDEVARAENVPLAQAYAALAFDPSLRQPSGDKMIALCVGSCQAQGALATLEALLAQTRQQPGLVVLVRQCLDLCAHSPACMSKGAPGVQAHARVQPTDVPQLVKTVLGG